MSYADPTSLVCFGIIEGIGLVMMLWGISILLKIERFWSKYSTDLTKEADTTRLKRKKIGIIILAIVSFLSYIWIDALNWGVFILSIITNFTVLQRIIYFRNALQTKNTRI